MRSYWLATFHQQFGWLLKKFNLDLCGICDRYKRTVRWVILPGYFMHQKMCAECYSVLKNGVSAPQK